jgi:hypothetical protein
MCHGVCFAVTLLLLATDDSYRIAIIVTSLCGSNGSGDTNNDAVYMSRLQYCMVTSVWEKLRKTSINFRLPSDSIPGLPVARLSG